MIMGSGRFSWNKDDEACVTEKILTQNVMNKFCEWEEQNDGVNFDIGYKKWQFKGL